MQDDSPTARAMALFDDYVEMPHHRQSRALKALEAEDALLHAELVSLLAVDAMQQVLKPLPLHTLAQLDLMREHGTTDLRIGKRVGPWKIDSMLGIGGMGVVYAAHRDDGYYEQHVALKFLRVELGSPSMLQAFETERRLLARLEHPAIVSMLDAGVDIDNHPWFVMQRINGEAIDQYCNQHRLSLAARVDVLIQACDAVAYAHSRGVLHLDIKPSNLLVNEEGTVKLLDFGLAAITAVEGLPPRARIALSSAYAAPEARRSSQPQAAEDVYSLGVVLYELLCGQAPLPLSLRLIGNKPGEAPNAPSTLARDLPPQTAALRGGATASALARSLRGDLDAIALHCVAENPAQRYAGVADLQHDLRAWREQRPISSRINDPGYRAWRFAQRNRMAVFGTLMAGGLAVAALGVASMEYLRAQRETESTLMLNSLFEQTLGTAVIGTGQMHPRIVLEESEQRLRARVPADKPLILARGLAALAVNYLTLDNTDNARKLLDEAQHLAGNDDMTLSRVDTARLQLLGSTYDYRGAVRVGKAGLQRLPYRYGHEDDLLRVELMHGLHDAYWNLGEHEQANTIMEQALAAAHALGSDGHTALARLLISRGSEANQHKHYKQAISDLRQAMLLSESIDPWLQQTAGRRLVHSLAMSGQASLAIRLSTKLLEQARTRFGENHSVTGLAWVYLGIATGESPNQTLSLRALQRGHAILMQDDGGNPVSLSFTRRMLALHAVRQGDLVQAAQWQREALALSSQTLGADHSITRDYRQQLIAMLARLDTPAARDEVRRQQSPTPPSQEARIPQAH